MPVFTQPAAIPHSDPQSQQHFVIPCSFSGKKLEESRDFMLWESLNILPSCPSPTPQTYLFVTNSICEWFLWVKILWAPFLRPLSKIEETYKQETRRKNKIEQENGRELPNDKLYTISISCWWMETPLEMGLEMSPPPFHPKENTLWVCDSALISLLSSQAFPLRIDNYNWS